MYKIIKREEMAHGTIVLNEIEAPQIAKKAKPGQFVILMANKQGERIPLTMADVDKEKGTITIVYMIIGKSTRLFAALKIGDAYSDVVGPLGQPREKRNHRLCGWRNRNCCYTPYYTWNV